MTYVVFIAICLLTLLAACRKWELKRAHSVPWAIAMSALGCAIILAAGKSGAAWPQPVVVIVALGAVYALSVMVMLSYFFRDPERTAPIEPGVIVSPADGRIVYVKEIDGGTFPFSVKGRNTIPLAEFSEVALIPDRGIQIGIAMNFLNVHVNRSPIAGQVEMVRRIPGQFASLKHIASLLENERVLMVTEGDGIRLGIVQIASRLVRRIVPYVAEGEQVDRGQRVGMIRFGSQVDVLLPHVAGLDLCIQQGDEVTAGETIIATFSRQERSQPQREGVQISNIVEADGYGPIQQIANRS